MAQIDGVLAELRDRIKRPFESGLPKSIGSDTGPPSMATPPSRPVGSRNKL